MVRPKIRERIEAFERSGGVDYLVTVAKTDPKTFCALLARIVPTEVKSELNDNVGLADRLARARARRDAPSAA